MDLYDQNGKPLGGYDPSQGYVKSDVRLVHHPAVEGKAAQGHYETIREYPNGGKDVAWIVDEPGVTAREAWDEEVPIQVYVPYTEEELSEREHLRQEQEEQRKRESALREAQVMFITTQINTLAVDDATALRWRMLYPEWSPDGVEYEVDDKVQRGDKLYKCQQAHTSQTNWAPEMAASLWTEINETHAGTEDDPIPYSGNMALESGKYYSQDGVTYRCTRDTGIPVYNTLLDLVGLYVEVAT